MKTIKREGIDVGTALSSTSKRMQSAGSVLPEDAHLADLPADPQPTDSAQPAAKESYVHGVNFKAKIKRVLRLIAKHGYRNLKPFIKPVAFRMRQYFLAGFSDHSANVARQQQATTEALLSKIEAQEHHVASMTAGQRLAAEKIDQLACAPQVVPEELLQQIKRIEDYTYATARLVTVNCGHDELMIRLLSRIEALEHHAASMAAGQRLAAERIDQLACAPQVVPEELLQQIKRIEDYTYASARRVAVNCGPDELMIRSEIGFVLCSASDHALIATLLEAGELEPGTRQLIHKILKPGDVYVDIGANIGMHMLAAAQAMQGRGKIIGFEPFGPTKALIDKTMWINGFSGIAETHQLAVSNKSGSQSLNLGATSGHHSLFKLDTPAALAKPPVQVDLISLDEIIKSDQVIHLLKIDAEGAELDVIEGAKRLLKNNPQIKLIVELGLSHLERTGHTVEDWLEKFSTLGFDYQVINANSGELETHSIEELKAAESVNLFFSMAKTADPLETKHEE